MSGPGGTEDLAPGTLEAWELHLGREVDAGSLRAELAEGTLPRAFHRVAGRVADEVALTIDGETVTHGELDRRAARLGGWLEERGVGSGRRVVLCGNNSVEFLVAYLGILRAGAVVVPAGAGLTEYELRHFVEDSGASCALAEGDALGRLRDIANAGGGLERLVALRGAGEEEIATLEQAISEGEPLEPGGGSGDDGAMLAYTSGTTGEPKGTPLTHGNLLASLRGAMWAWRWTEEDVLVHALPFSHQHGLSGAQITLLSGARAVVHSSFDPELFCSTVESEKATVIFAVPAIYEKLAGWDGIGEKDLSSLRLAASGSAALSPELAQKVSSVLGQKVLERYGSTETGLSVSNPYEGERQFGSVGFPLPGTELLVVDGENNPLPPGEAGEILLRGPQVFAGYWERPEATEESFYPGGWFRTGDVGRVDPEDGRLAITGRLKELIITGGMNVYPREVEFALESHAAVDGAAVVGVPSERWGEEVVAFVVSGQDRPVETGELEAHAREQLSSYKVPKRFFEVEEFPRNEMGKVLQDELIELAQEEN
ncbi:MAG: class I adenylate-forming enzyme family protein [Rubrobacteraceae bacterium]